MSDKQDREQPKTPSSRRAFIAGAAAVGAGAPVALFTSRVLAIPRTPLPASDLPICRTAAEGPAAAGPLKKISFAWNAAAPCLVSVTVAKDKGFFTKHGLDVELINYSGSTDQLLETLATGKADAAIGMALRWLKPLEQGFDVKIVSSAHGGCLRLLVPSDSGLSDIRSLKGKTVAVSDMNAPARNFFAVALKKAGVDPAEVDFKPYPGPLLRVAVEKGEAHALADQDPNTYLWLKDGKFTELSTNLSGEYAHRACCIVGVRGTLVREDKATAAAIARALIEAAEFTHANPADAAATYLPYAPGSVSLEDLTTLAKYHTHHEHPTGAALREQLASYAEELKLVSVLKPSTDTAKYAARIYADVLS